MLIFRGVKGSRRAVDRAGNDHGNLAIEVEKTLQHGVVRRKNPPDRFDIAGRLPGGRGHGEPLKLMFEMGQDTDIVALFVYAPGAKLLVAADDGRGFLAPQDDVVAQTRGGRQVLNVKGDVEARLAVPGAGDHIAVIGDNRKMLIFPAAELPTMGRGRGVRLQSYAKGGLLDAKFFTLKDGLTVKTGDRSRTFEPAALGEWLGKRAQAGRLPPAGFPRANKFGDIR